MCSVVTAVGSAVPSTTSESPELPLTEILVKQLTDSCVNINGYRLLRRDRVNTKGGGVCFYVKNDIMCEECQFDSHNVCIEIKWIRVLHLSCVYYIACCYYPPKPRHTADQFIGQLCSDLDNIMSNNDTCTVIVTGDFNKLNNYFP